MIDRDEVATRIYVEMVRGYDPHHPFGTTLKELAKRAVEQADVLMAAISENNKRRPVPRVPLSPPPEDR